MLKLKKKEPVEAIESDKKLLMEYKIKKLKTMIPCEDIQLTIKKMKTEKYKKQKEEDNATIYVAKWIDYSSKYGISYVLSNGLTGMFFNDNSKMI